MSAYWIGRLHLLDPNVHKKYSERVQSVIDPYGGKFVVRGGRFEILEGSDKFERFVIIEFPTFEQGVACFKSPEYQEIAAIRRGGGSVIDLAVVEGI